MFLKIKSNQSVCEPECSAKSSTTAPPCGKNAQLLLTMFFYIKNQFVWHCFDLVKDNYSELLINLSINGLMDKKIKGKFIDF